MSYVLFISEAKLKDSTAINLNVDVDFLDGVIPTAENLAIKFWEILEPKINKGRLYEVKLYESERNYVVYRGDVYEPNI